MVELADGICLEMMDGGDPYAADASWYKRNRITIFLAADANGMPRLGTFGVTKEGENKALAMRNGQK